MFLAIFTKFLFLFAESGFMHWWHESAEPYLNYPGFEAWKFINLTIFVGILYFLLKKPLSAAFKAKRDEIQAELIAAQADRESAMKTLEDAEAKFSMLDSERLNIKDKAFQDGEAEKARIAEQTASEIEKIKLNASTEIAGVTQSAKRELRRYSADEAIKLAEQMIKEKIGTAESAQLVKTSIDGLGGTN